MGFRALQGPEYAETYIFEPFRALQGPEYPKHIIFYMVPGLAKPGIPKTYHFLHGSGPCKARNTQNVPFFTWFRALQGPEYPKRTIFYMVPGLAKPRIPKMPSTWIAQT